MTITPTLDFPSFIEQNQEFCNQTALTTESQEIIFNYLTEPKNIADHYGHFDWTAIFNDNAREYSEFEFCDELIDFFSDEDYDELANFVFYLGLFSGSRSTRQVDGFDEISFTSTSSDTVGTISSKELVNSLKSEILANEQSLSALKDHLSTVLRDCEHELRDLGNGKILVFDYSAVAAA